jgi:tRNA pseudouridine55 synthase
VARLGVRTETLDAEGAVVSECDLPLGLGPEALERLLPRFRGVIDQQVPRYSAVKVEGERLYARARRGERVTTPVRQVQILALELTDWTPPHATLSLVCSKGTYVRQLVADLGDALGVGAHVAALRRTRVGPFAVAEATPLASLVGRAEVDAACLSLPAAVSRFLPVVPVPPDVAAALRTGRAVTWAELADQGLAPETIFAALAGDDLVAVAAAGPSPQSPCRLLRVFVPGA